MNKKGNVKIFKLILLIIVLLISIGIILYLFPVMKNLSTIEGQVAFKEKVDNSGVMGLLMLFGLQVAQIFLIIVPGEPIEILSGMCYGGLILFLIPGTPKDLLVYVAGLLPIKPLKFILISTFARFPSVITSTLAGEQLAIGDWKMSIVLYGIILIFVAILVFIINKLDKDKITKEAINSIK